MISSPPDSRDVRIRGGRTAVTLLLVCAAFVVVGAALIAVPHASVGAKIAGALTIAVFGPLPLYAGLRMLRSGGVYVLGSDGIRFPLNGWPVLPWSDIQGTRIVVRRRRRYLVVDTPTANARVRQMKSGSRAARQNLRIGLGLMPIPEQMAPTSLEELQRKIERRRTGSAASTSRAASGSSDTTILPASAMRAPTSNRSAWQGSSQALRNVAAGNALVLILAMLRHHHVRTPQALIAAIVAALLIGALAVHLEAVFTGWVTIVTAEIVLVVVDLTVGQVAVASRLLDLFFPFCVLFVAAQAWPQHRRSRS
ncbi:MAG TPA: STM3941 family protein [Acidothermaceae bacterium]